MENNQTTPEEKAATPGLWLSNRWLGAVTGMAGLGKTVMVIALIVGAVRSFSSLYVQYYIWAMRLAPDRDFFLFEDYNWLYVFNTLSLFALIYLYFRGIIEGYKAFQQFQDCSVDDEALLDGQERLGKMFTWLCWWAGAYVLLTAFEYFFHYA
ncbi:MAG TPA: hypothetical protein DCF33_19270 [Saprospirales bacterium]|nr:hypothetical protein [Saprospirales bacterium]